MLFFVGPTGRQIPADVHKQPDGSYRVEYTVQEVGKIEKPGTNASLLDD